jgi:serine phosphatase RsbU (regulator of sigma subunit)
VPCLLSPGRSPRELETFVFPPLGIGDSSRLTTTSTTLAPGDRVVFFSDGVVERRHLAGRLGVAGFLDHVGVVPDPSAASLLTHIVSHVSGLHETPLDDDATVLVLGVLDDRVHEPWAHAPEPDEPEAM